MINEDLPFSRHKEKFKQVGNRSFREKFSKTPVFICAGDEANEHACMIKYSCVFS